MERMNELRRCKKDVQIHMLTLTCTFMCESHFSTKWETNLKKLMQRLDESYVYLYVCTWEIKLSQRKIGASTH